MDSLIEIDKEFDEVKQRRRDAIIKAFDGRTQQHIAKNTMIDPTKLNKWISGLSNLEDEELSSLEKYLGVDFK